VAGEERFCWTEKRGKRRKSPCSSSLSHEWSEPKREMFTALALRDTGRGNSWGLYSSMPGVWEKKEAPKGAVNCTRLRLSASVVGRKKDKGRSASSLAIVSGRGEKLRIQERWMKKAPSPLFAKKWGKESGAISSFLCSPADLPRGHGCKSMRGTCTESAGWNMKGPSPVAFQLRGGKGG